MKFINTKTSLLSPILLSVFIQISLSQSYHQQDSIQYSADKQSLQNKANESRPSSNDIPADSIQLLQTNSSALKWYTMFQRIPGDWIACWDLTVRKDNIPIMIGVTGLTAIAIVTDRPVWESSNKLYYSSKASKKISDFFVYLGDGKPQFGLSAAFATYGFLAKDNRALRTASQITETVLACGSVIQVIKHITGRESPFVATTRNGKWKFFPNQIEYHKHVPEYDAYPSGHIATSLATLIVILENYPETKSWLRPIGYAIVGGIGVGLSNRGIHWWSDYPLGLYLGYQFGMIASHPEGLDNEPSGSGTLSKINVQPSITPLGAGISISYHF